jgi:uroporphyrinogen decarboxylase
MRQAGRYMEEYRKLRLNYSILELIKDPELAAEVTMQPIRAFDLDAAIIFADILPPLEALGLQLSFQKGEGPVIHNPIRSPRDVEALRTPEVEKDLAFTLDAIRIVRRELSGRAGLIGFSGAPFTLASYAIEGGASRNYILCKRFMYEQPKAWDQLMSSLAEMIGDYLFAQASAGAQVLQLFDSWVGALSPRDYRKYVLPYSRRAIEKAQAAGVPVIHFGTGTSGMLDLIMEAGGDVIGVDWRIDIGKARAVIEPSRAIQGNLDPVVLFAEPDIIRDHAVAILDAMSGSNGFIFNLGHGILPGTPVENVAMLVDFVHDYTGQ